MILALTWIAKKKDHESRNNLIRWKEWDNKFAKTISIWRITLETNITFERLGVLNAKVKDKIEIVVKWLYVFVCVRGNKWTNQKDRKWMGFSVWEDPHKSQHNQHKKRWDS